MAMFLDSFLRKCSALLVDAVFEEAITVLGVEEEVKKLLEKMKWIRCVLNDAEKKKFEDSSIHLWLVQLKDVMYDADDIFELCTIKGDQLRLLSVDEDSKNETFRVCTNLSSRLSSFFPSVSLRRRIGKRIRDCIVRLEEIRKNKEEFHLQISDTLEITEITTLVDPRQAGLSADPLVVGGEVKVAANELVNLLIKDMVEEKCRIFAVVGKGGIGKTTLARKIFSHPRVENCFSLKVWVTVSQTYSETELLKQIIEKANGNYGDANTTSELLPILRDSVRSYHSVFLILDNVRRAYVWFQFLRAHFQTASTSVRVLVTTRNAAVAKALNPAHTHDVNKLSSENSWEMLHKLVFSDAEEPPSNELEKLGTDIVQRCGFFPLAIKIIAGVLNTRARTRMEWQNILKSYEWSIRIFRDLDGDHHIAALHLSFEDLPSRLKQCFLYFSLYGQDACLYPCTFARLWFAEGFITENIDEGSSMEDVAKENFNELLKRNLLRGGSSDECTMHDLVRSLAISLSEGENFYGDANVRSSNTSTRLRRLSIEGKKQAEATKIFDSVAKQGALRTLLASNSDLQLNEKRLKWLSCLRVLDISWTKIKELPECIGDLVHLRYLNLSGTEITAIPESIGHLSYLQFLGIFACTNLTKLPDALHNLRHLKLFDTNIM